MVPTKWTAVSGKVVPGQVAIGSLEVFASTRVEGVEVSNGGSLEVDAQQGPVGTVDVDWDEEKA